LKLYRIKFVKRFLMVKNILCALRISAVNFQNGIHDIMLK